MKGPIVRLIDLVRDERKGFVTALLASFATHVSTVVTVASLGWVVGRAWSHGSIRLPLIVLASAVFARAVLWWAEMSVAHDLAYRVIARLRLLVFDAFASIGPGGLTSQRSGDLATRSMADVELCEWFLAHTVTTVSAGLVVSATTVGVLAAFSAPSAVVAGCGALGLGALPWLLARWAEAGETNLRQASAETSANTTDLIWGMTDLTLLDPDGAWVDRATRAESGSSKWRDRRALVTAAEVATSLALLGAVSVLAVESLTASLRRNDISAASVPLVLALTIGAMLPVWPAAEASRRLGGVRAAVRRFTSVLDRAATAAEPPVVTNASEPFDLSSASTVRFHDVSYSYDWRRKPAVANITFELQPGECVALVGPSGAGKSTSAHLLLKWWHPATGAIEVGGHDLRTLDREILGRLVTFVPQDTHLFPISLADNISLGVPRASREEVKEAARRAMAHEFIAALPSGYDTNPGERGVRLSGGQRQRIAIARAMLRDAPILVLDEVSSNLDDTTEAELRAAMRAAATGRTTLVIAHRQATVDACDRVISLRDGRLQ